MSQNPIPFNPNNLPERPTAIFNVDGTRIGTFNPHTLIIHPTSDSAQGPMKLLGSMAFDMSGNLVGKFTDGLFNAESEEASV